MYLFPAQRNTKGLQHQHTQGLKLTPVSAQQIKMHLYLSEKKNKNSLKLQINTQTNETNVQTISVLINKHIHTPHRHTSK